MEEPYQGEVNGSSKDDAVSDGEGTGRRHGNTTKAAKQFVTLFADMAVRETKKNGMFVIPGIGRLVRVDRKARMGRNPATGEAIKIPGKESGEVPRRQSCKGRDRSTKEEVSRNPINSNPREELRGGCFFEAIQICSKLRQVRKP